jgi:cytochrome P450
VVHVSQWVTFRNPEHFLEPDSFCPERWLKSTHPLYESKFANDNRDVFKPFSYGPRDCIGKNLAYAEMRLIVSHLLYRFDFEVLPGQDDWHATQNTYLIWEKGPLYIKFSARGR